MAMMILFLTTELTLLLLSSLTMCGNFCSQKGALRHRNLQ